MSAFYAVLAQTVILSFRVGGGALIGVLFFLSVLVVVPFGVGPDLNLLARIGPALLFPRLGTRGGKARKNGE